jgi:putative sigma-54 modulation protein
VAGRGVTVAPGLRRRIEAKIAKVERVLPRIVEGRVVLATERYRHLVEVTLQAKRANFHVGGAAADFAAALDEALARLVQQVRRRKERVVGRHKPRPSRRASTRRAAPAAPEPAEDGGLTVRRTNPKPMSLDEAIEQLRLRRDGLLVFRNARTRAVNVLRRRPDGTVELVEPGG